MNEFTVPAKQLWDEKAREYQEKLVRSREYDEDYYDKLTPEDIFDLHMDDFHQSINELREELGGPAGVQAIKTLEASLIDIPPVQMVYPEDLSRDSIAEAWKTHFEEPEMER